jgi:DNA ligase-1
MSLRQFIDTLNECEQESSRKQKEEYLNQIKDNRFLQKTTTLVFDPFITLGVTVPDLSPNSGIEGSFQTEDELYDNFNEIVALLSSRALTGSAALRRVSSFLLSIADQNTRGWFAKFLNKKFVTGLGLTTISKIYPELKAPYGVQLASPLHNWEFLDNGSTWVAEPKMDGIRCIMFIDQNGNTVALSRSLKELNFDNLKHIAGELTPLLTEGYVIDGELLATNWDDTMSIVSSQFEHPNRETVSFHIFDILPFNSFAVGGSSLPQRQRTKILSLFFAQKSVWSHLVRVKQVLISSREDAENITAQFISEGFEGSVLKDLGAPYENSRSKFWIKVKSVSSEDLPIVGVTNGENKFSKPPSTRLINKTAKIYGLHPSEFNDIDCLVGSLQVQELSGAISGVGSGLDDVTRLYLMYLHKRNELIGRIIEVEFQEKTKDSALRFGVFLRLRDDK